MEVYRWILILAGVVLLGAAFFIGRKRNAPGVGFHRAVREPYDPAVDELSLPLEDLPVGRGENNTQGLSTDNQSQRFTASDRVSGQSGSRSQSVQMPPVRFEATVDDPLDGQDFASEHYQAIATEAAHETPATTSFSDAVKLATQTEEWETEDQLAFDDAVFTDEFETYNDAPHLQGSMQSGELEEKLVTVHVVAARDRRFYGKDLRTLFNQHDYQLGDMSLYHCFLDGDKVFSIANMVKPGTFSEADMETFETPGITMFMRLPVELDASVAFNFLINEAKEIASELSGHLRDGNRNPLSEQTIQHMREDVQQYVFRTKNAVAPTV